MVFGFLFGNKSRTADWPAYDLRPLCLDLDTSELNGVGPGQSIDRLSFLGPDSDPKAARVMSYRYRLLGLDVDCREDFVIDSYYLTFNDEFGEGYVPYSGQLRSKGESLKDFRQLEFWLGHFGEPYHTDSDEDEAVLYYVFPHAEWQVEFDNQAMISGLLITDQHSLADPDTRMQMGAHKPWPLDK